MIVCVIPGVFAYLIRVPNGHYLKQKQNKIILKFYSTCTSIIHLSPSGLLVSIYLKYSREKEMSKLNYYMQFLPLFLVINNTFSSVSKQKHNRFLN